MDGEADALDQMTEIPQTATADPRLGALSSPRPVLVPVADPHAAVSTSGTRMVVANLQLPEALVHARAQVHASGARTQGAPHTMRLWRVAYEQAVLELAREAAQLPAQAPCEALFWGQRGPEFWVSATFSPPAAAPVH
jgi:hypothetical protein